jgi:type I restriction-modification system DNA methylase subunit
MESPWGKIPYLNGGLFDRDYGEGIIDALGLETPRQITLPNSLFAPLAGSDQSILNFFNMYNFTISENITGEEDIAIDPEMLGKVFENTLAAPERGKTGTFYTPRKIVEFMCTEALVRYLSDETGMSVDRIKQIIDTYLDYKEYISLITTEEIKNLNIALTNLKALDPAVGSGAFPLGLMQIILKVKQVIARREGMTIERGSLVISQWKREIISHNLYGVDIKPEAIEIAKLRMWLSLVVDIPNLENVEPLPNLDYKLMCGDSLISTVNGENLIPVPQQQQQLLLDVTPIQSAIQPLLELQELYFNAEAQSRSNLRQEILAAERNIFQVAIGVRVALPSADRTQLLENQLKEIEVKLNRMKGKSAKKWEQDKAEIKNKITQLKALTNSVAKGEKALNFFQYYLHFRDVFDSKGGFDLVIGNPPYVRQEEIKELKPALQQEYECYTGVADLYVYFYEKGFNLLKSGGYLTYISSNKWFRSNYGEKLRKFLAENGRIEYLIDFGDASIFDATVDTNIILVSKNQAVNHNAYVLNWKPEAALNEFPAVFKQRSFLIQQKSLTPDGWRLESPTVLALLDKLKAAGTPLGEYVNGRFYYGIKTGFNEAFIVDQETRDRLISEHPSSAEVLKPLIRGRDVKRWCVNYQDLYLLFIPWHFPLHHDQSIQGVSKKAEKFFKQDYPAIYDHLLNFQDQLSSRNKAETGIRYEWYALQRCAASYWQEFETPKIVYPDIFTKTCFTFDQCSLYLSNTAYFIHTTEKWMCGLLNSKLINWFYQFYSNTLGDANRSFSIYIKEIPIPPVPGTDRPIIENLVQKCLDAKGKGVEKYEQEIDDRIAQLYGLTPEEIKIIRGETP